MTPDEQRSILTIGMYAAFADGDKDERERQELRRIAESLADVAHAPSLARIYQDVLLKRVSLADAAAQLGSGEGRQLAYELAVCVCDADGRQNSAEHEFLGSLKTQLQLDTGHAAEFDEQANTIVELEEAVFPAAGTGALAGEMALSANTTQPLESRVSTADLDQSILNHALFAGGLELLPQSWASMAIIPLQMKMVYGIGKTYGYELDQGHIKEFVAAAGVGLGGQYLEQFGRKLLGGLLGKLAGKTVGRIGNAGAGIAFSFATTYALGQLSKRYYAGGRKMDSALLRETFQSLLEPAKRLQTEYAPQISRQAQTIDMGRIMSMMRGGIGPV